MGLFDYIKNKFNPPKNYTEDELKFLHALGLTPNDNQSAINEVTYYTCCKLISESIGKLPFELFQNVNGSKEYRTDLDLHYLLTKKPNKFYNSTIMITSLMTNTLRTGNGYIYLKYVGYRLKEMYLLPSNRVTVLVDNKGILNGKGLIYQYTDTDNKVYNIPSDNIIHIKTSDTIDGIIGRPVSETLALTLGTSIESQAYLNNLIKNGLNSRAVLHYTGDLNPQAEERLIKGIERYTKGSANAGNILPLPIGLDLKPLDMKLADAQFFEIKELTSLAIASAFQVSPTFINIYGNSSYNNSSQESLRFLSNCLQFYLVQLENEVNYKCLTKKQIEQGYYCKMNVAELLRTDLLTQSQVHRNYIESGALTINDVRQDLDYNNIEGGDKPILNGSYTTLDNIINGINYNVKDDKGGDNDNDKLQE